MADEVRLDANPDRILAGPQRFSWSYLHNIRYVRLAPIRVVVPKTGDVGLDLVAAERVALWPFQTVKVPTGVGFGFPDGIFGFVAERSSVGAMGVGVLARIIDTSYTGEIIVVLHNFSLRRRVFEKGERIAQLVPLHVANARYIEADELAETWRGSQGFGEGTNERGA